MIYPFFFALLELEQILFLAPLAPMPYQVLYAQLILQKHRLRCCG
jgi:hypothetical protein